SRSRLLSFTNFSKEYAMSLYWSALTITTCGQQPWPANSAQNMLEVVDTLFGVFVFATILGAVGSVVSEFNEERTAFQTMLDRCKFYMKYRHMDNEKVNYISLFLFQQWKEINRYSVQEALAYLPPRLEGMLAVHVHMKTLVRAKLFQNCDYGFIYELVLKLRQQLYSPGDYICQLGERSQAMYIVKEGLAVIEDPTKPSQRIRMGEGSTFGELSIIYVPGLSTDKRSLA
ncbi:hypothetical protein PFISCL1PPCAC_14641, partial [Pristionchus fissidentatus]